jgi:hypothetical protein
MEFILTILLLYWETLGSGVTFPKRYTGLGDGPSNLKLAMARKICLPIWEWLFGEPGGEIVFLNCRGMHDVGGNELNLI